MRFVPIALATAALLGASTPGVQAGLSTCAQTIAYKLTNVFEYGDQDLHYDYCEHIQGGRGYASGIAGFTTGTGDAIQVLKEFDRLAGDKNDLNKFEGVIEKLSDQDSDDVEGLDGYCGAWKKLGKDSTKFQEAQRNIRDKLYSKIAADHASKLGLKLAITQAQLYDAIVQHGEGNEEDSLNWLINETNKSFDSDKTGDSGSTLTINGKKVDEIVWLINFLDNRYDNLWDPSDVANKEAWRDTIGRVESYQFIARKKQYNWDKEITALDNEGKEIKLSC
ncbi:chitosanase [Ramicandelaber brevisporus]|nr:chitosanase [Ramicandelaber brevisporus]